MRRGNEVPQDFTGIVFDIGGGAFDHHGNDEKKRENGVPYAAFGLLWQQLGTAVLGDEKQAEKFDFRFVQPLDQNDNTGEPDEIASLIADFNPVWDADEDTDAASFGRQISRSRSWNESSLILRAIYARTRR